MVPLYLNRNILFFSISTFCSCGGHIFSLFLFCRFLLLDILFFYLNVCIPHYIIVVIMLVKCRDFGSLIKNLKSLSILSRAIVKCNGDNVFSRLRKKSDFHFQFLSYWFILLHNPDYFFQQLYSCDSIKCLFIVNDEVVKCFDVFPPFLS